MVAAHGVPAAYFIDDNGLTCLYGAGFHSESGPFSVVRVLALALP
jgi:hypothetical protein